MFYLFICCEFNQVRILLTYVSCVCSVPTVLTYLWWQSSHECVYNKFSSKSNMIEKLFLFVNNHVRKKLCSNKNNVRKINNFKTKMWEKIVLQIIGSTHFTAWFWTAFDTLVKCGTVKLRNSILYYWLSFLYMGKQCTLYLHARKN